MFQVIATGIALLKVDHLGMLMLVLFLYCMTPGSGRRPLLLIGTVIMFVSLVVLASISAADTGDDSSEV